jgi:hypothetical protein
MLNLPRKLLHFDTMLTEWVHIHAVRDDYAVHGVRYMYYRIFLLIRHVLSDFLDPKNIDASYLSMRLVCWRLIFELMITAWNKKYLHVQFKSTIFVWRILTQ